MTDSLRVQVTKGSRRSRTAKSERDEKNGYGHLEVPVQETETDKNICQGRVIEFHTVATGEKRDRVKSYAIIVTDENEIIREEIENLKHRPVFTTPKRL